MSRAEHWKNIVTLVGAAVMILLLLIAGVAAAEDIVLGSAISQTGKYAREGKFYVDAYTLTVDAINKAGGVKVGGKTSHLALKLYDDQSDPSLSVRLFTKLVSSDKINFLLGPYSSGITIPASAVAEKFEIPMIQGGGASGKIFDRGYKYIFGTLPKAELYFQSAIEASAPRRCCSRTRPSTAVSPRARASGSRNPRSTRSTTRSISRPRRTSRRSSP
jgi:branched-chain amino acid transport system substrate-binding protein